MAREQRHTSDQPMQVIPPGRMSFRHLHSGRSQTRSGTSTQTTHSHLEEHNPVAKTSATRPNLVGSMATFHSNVYTNKVDRQATQKLGQWNQPQLRTWPAYYEPSSQMICQMGPATDGETPRTDQTWQYHSQAATSTRRFLAIPKSNIFQDSRPETDAIPVTILRETTTELRCSLPQS